MVIGPPSILQGPRSEPFWFDAAAGERIDLVTQPGRWRPAIQHQGEVSGRPSMVDRVALATIWRPKDPAPAAPAGWAGRTGPARSETAAPPPATPTTSAVVEGSRYEIPLGDETRTIDNSKSSSSTMRVVRLTREWARTCAVDVDHITTVRGSAGLGLHVLTLKAEAERTLNKKYSATTEERETFEEEVTLNIGKNTKSEIIFSWKEIRQKGVVHIAGGDLEVQIPYEVVAGVTFDQQQIDIP